MLQDFHGGIAVNGSDEEKNIAARRADPLFPAEQKKGAKRVRKNYPNR